MLEQEKQIRTVIDLFKSADAAMYASKQHGKDRYSFRE